MRQGSFRVVLQGSLDPRDASDLYTLDASAIGPLSAKNHPSTFRTTPL